MKVVNKIFAFFVAVCVIAPLLGQTASAAYCVENVPQGGCIIECGNENAIIDAIPALNETSLVSNAVPYSDTSGTRVRNIAVYPVAKNLDTETLYWEPSIYKRVTFVSSGPSEGIYLTKSQTDSLVSEMKNHINSLSGKYEMYGWRITGTVTFEYDRLRYITYYGESFSQKFQEHREELSGSSVSKVFKMILPYPKYVDIDNEYYFVGISGTCYYQSSTGTQMGTPFGFGGRFNRG